MSRWPAWTQRLGGGFLTPATSTGRPVLTTFPTPRGVSGTRGNLETGIPTPSRCAAVTGSRDSTSYGAAVTGDIAYGLAQRGICVISGLAYGIDARPPRRPGRNPRQRTGDHRR